MVFPARRLTAALALLLAGPVWPQQGHGWIDVPFVKQRGDGCGAASASMVMQYWRLQGYDVDLAAADASTIYNALYSDELQGIAASRLREYLDSHGFRTFIFEAQWQDLRHHVSQGRPLIVCLQESKRLHYVVAVGLDEQEGLVLLNDPSRRKLTKMDRGDFISAWKATGNRSLLALPQANP
jgi:predicted double-glycine peptidase